LRQCCQPAAPVSGLLAMADSCATCFFMRTDANTALRCAVHAPHWQRGVTAPGAPSDPLNNWPVVAPDNWCGEGYNTSTSSWHAPAAGPTAIWVAPNPNPGSKLTHIVGTAAAQNILIMSGAGWITGVSVNAVATGTATLTCYDGVDATGTVIAVIDITRGNPSPQTAAPWGFSVGFFVVVSNGATGADITIVSHAK